MEDKLQYPRSSLESVTNEMYHHVISYLCTTTSILNLATINKRIQNEAVHVIQLRADTNFEIQFDSMKLKHKTAKFIIPKPITNSVKYMKLRMRLCDDEVYVGSPKYIRRFLPQFTELKSVELFHDEDACDALYGCGLYFESDIKQFCQQMFNDNDSLENNVYNSGTNNESFAFKRKSDGTKIIQTQLKLSGHRVERFNY